MCHALASARMHLHCASRKRTLNRCSLDFFPALVGSVQQSMWICSCHARALPEVEQKREPLCVDLLLVRRRGKGKASVLVPRSVPPLTRPQMGMLLHLPKMSLPHLIKSPPKTGCSDRLRQRNNLSLWPCSIVLLTCSNNKFLPLHYVTIALLPMHTPSAL